jgi:hypothetical protein
MGSGLVSSISGTCCTVRASVSYSFPGRELVPGTGSASAAGATAGDEMDAEEEPLPPSPPLDSCGSRAAKLAT